MNIKSTQTITISSLGILDHLSNSKMTYFLGYTVGTQTISTTAKKGNEDSRKAVINSLERSLKENADVWVELSKH